MVLHKSAILYTIRYLVTRIEHQLARDWTEDIGWRFLVMRSNRWSVHFRSCDSLVSSASIDAALYSSGCALSRSRDLGKLRSRNPGLGEGCESATGCSATKPMMPAKNVKKPL